MKKKSLIIVCVSFLILCKLVVNNASIVAEELILKVKESPTIAGWIYQKGKLENSYCLYERNYMILASANLDALGVNPILNIFKEHESDILSSSFSISNKRFISLDADGILIERIFADNSKVNMRKVHEKLKPSSAAISPDDSMELVGFKNGFIQSHSLLKKTKKNVDVYFKAHAGNVYSISFNALGSYFASSGEDGKIKIWKAKDLSLIREIETVKKDGEFLPVPATFSPLNDVFVYASSEKMLAFSDIRGNNINTVFVADGIKKVHFTEKKDAIAVLTSTGNLEFYSISKGKYLGTIPTLNELSISSISINIVTGSLLVATTGGEIYLCTSDEIQKVKVAKKNRKKEQVKDDQIARTVQIQENAIEYDKTPKLSDNMLKYFGLEEGVNVKIQVRKPFFPIKDETPLESPISVLRQKPKEPKKEKNEVVPPKTINQTIFDEEVKFQPIMQEEDSYEEESDEKKELEDSEQKAEAILPEEDDDGQEDEKANENEDNASSTDKNTRDTGKEQQDKNRDTGEEA